MKKLLLTIICIFVSMKVTARIVAPSSMIANDPGKYLKRSDLVIKGCGAKVYNRTQLFVFKLFRAFLGNDRIYYLFARHDGLKYFIEHGFFIEDRYAQKIQFPSKLNKTITESSAGIYKVWLVSPLRDWENLTRHYP